MLKAIDIRHLYEKGTDRIVVMDPTNSLSKQLGNRKLGDNLATPARLGQRNGIGHHEFLQVGLIQIINSSTTQNRMTDRCTN